MNTIETTTPVVYVQRTKRGVRYYHFYRRFFPMSKAAALAAVDNGAIIRVKPGGPNCHWLNDPIVASCDLNGNNVALVEKAA